MTITVVDTQAGMAAVLDAPPAARADILRQMLAPMAGMYRFIPGQPDLATMHAMS